MHIILPPALLLALAALLLMLLRLRPASDSVLEDRYEDYPQLQRLIHLKDQQVGRCTRERAPFMALSDLSTSCQAFAAGGMQLCEGRQINSNGGWNLCGAHCLCAAAMVLGSLWQDRDGVLPCCCAADQRQPDTPVCTEGRLEEAQTQQGGVWHKVSIAAAAAAAGCSVYCSETS